MILGEGNRMADSAATLDDLFRRAGVRHPDALALADAPNREDFTDGPPRTLTFAEVDRAISAFAAKLRHVGLSTDAIVALQLPNTVESIVAFLGVLRAGMIAAPLPILWRQQDIVSALSRIGAKAIVTASRIGVTNHTEIAMQAAVELFPVRQVCSFGRTLSDGIVPLDDIFASDHVDTPAHSPRVGPAAAHIAAITFDLDFVPIARSHVELVAGGLETFLEAGAAADLATLSTIPIGSFAGLSLTLVHWLLSGGSLHLHHNFDPDAFATQCGGLGNAIAILPASTIAAVADAGLLTEAGQIVVALWRAPERMISAKAWTHPSIVVDVASFGEIGLIAARRDANGLPTPISNGVADPLHRPSGAPKVIETVRNEAGMLALKGRMVPAYAFPPGSGREQVPRSQPQTGGFLETGFPCRPGVDTRSLTITAPPAGVTTVGGYRFRQRDVDASVTQADPTATIVAVPDGDLGQRLAGSAGNPTVLRTALQAQGFNPLISGAFRPRSSFEAA